MIQLSFSLSHSAPDASTGFDWSAWKMRGAKSVTELKNP